jgi:hypothetical protein
MALQIPYNYGVHDSIIMIFILFDLEAELLLMTLLNGHHLILFVDKSAFEVVHIAPAFFPVILILFIGLTELRH